MKNITVIHMGAVGDLVQALPLLRAVRAKWPAAKIALVGHPERAAIARLAGLADACVHFDSFSNSLAAHQRADLVVDLFCAGRPGPAYGGTVRLEPLPPPGWTDSAAAWVLRQGRQALDLPAVPEAPEFLIPRASLDAAADFLAARGIRGNFAAIHPGSGSPKKNWPLDRFVAAAGRLRQEHGRTVVWLAGPAEQERGTLAPLGAGENVLARLRLEQAAAVLALTDVYVGNDSGITHLAAAVRRTDGRPTPTVALFGPTDPRLWAPRGPHVRVVRSPDGMMEGIGTERAWAEIARLVDLPV